MKRKWHGIPLAVFLFFMAILMLATSQDIYPYFDNDGLNTPWRGTGLPSAPADGSPTTTTISSPATGAGTPESTPASTCSGETSCSGSCPQGQECTNTGYGCICTQTTIITTTTLSCTLSPDGTPCGGNGPDSRCMVCRGGLCFYNDLIDCSLDGSGCAYCAGGRCLPMDNTYCGGYGVWDSLNREYACGICSERRCIANNHVPCGPNPGGAYLHLCRWCQDKSCVSVPNDIREVCGRVGGVQICVNGNCEQSR